MRRVAKAYTSVLGKKLGNGASYPWIMSLDDFGELK
jgi:hypothetical protein